MRLIDLHGKTKVIPMRELQLLYEKSTVQSDVYSYTVGKYR